MDIFVINAQSDFHINLQLNHVFQFVQLIKFIIHRLANVNVELVTILFKVNVMYVKLTSFIKLQFKIVFQFVELMKFIHSNKRNVFAEMDFI